MRYPEEVDDFGRAWLDHALGKAFIHVEEQIGKGLRGQMEHRYHEALWHQIAATWFVGSQLQQISDSLENINNNM